MPVAGRDERLAVLGLVHALDEAELLELLEGAVDADESQGAVSAAGCIVDLKGVTARELAATVWMTARRAGVRR